MKGEGEMIDFVELENKLLEKNREYEELVDEYKDKLLEAVQKRNEAKKQYAIVYLEIKAGGTEDAKKKITEEKAKQKAFLETYELQAEAEIAKALVDALYERIEQLKYEIDSLRSILSAYKETYERTVG